MAIRTDGMQLIGTMQWIRKALVMFKGLERECGVLSLSGDAQEAESNLIQSSITSSAPVSLGRFVPDMPLIACLSDCGRLFK